MGAMNTAAPPTLILHHYNESPYAEKIRAMLGFKGLAWQSVVVPMMMPKPDMTALTGGYRKVPVLQVGADVYCDTRLIARVLDKLAPSQTVMPDTGWSEVIAHWVDVNFFGKAVAYTFSQIVDFLSDDFLADRAALSGMQGMSREAVKQSGPQARLALERELAWVEQGLKQAQPFVGGDTPTHGDFALYCALWFVKVSRLDLSAYPATLAWMKRMKSFGHGTRNELAAQMALDVARDTEPAELDYEAAGTAPSSDPSADPMGLRVGQRVTVRPEVMGQESVEGELIGLNAEQLTLRLQSERCGTVHVHFPRTGYRVKPVSNAG